MKKTITVLFHALMLTYRPREVRKNTIRKYKKITSINYPCFFSRLWNPGRLMGREECPRWVTASLCTLLAQYLRSEHSPRFVELAVYNSSVTRAR